MAHKLYLTLPLTLPLMLTGCEDVKDLFEVGDDTATDTGWYCFVAGTRVLTPSGRSSIESLRVGDEVWSWDIDRGEAVAKRVARVMKHRAAVRRIQAGEHVIEGVSDEHPFWSPERREWVTAAQLAVGDTVLVWLGADEPRALAITAIDLLADEAEVFNLSIEGEHQNYFAESILVHNKSPAYDSDYYDDTGEYYCFVAGTRVLTPSGRAAIETLRVGDEVWSWDVERGEAVARRVINTLRNRAAVRRIQAGEHVIEGVSSEHPFWNPERREWVKAAQLKVGEPVLVWLGADEARVLPITAIDLLDGDAEVFNLSVEGEENYFAENILVHNKSPNVDTAIMAIAIYHRGTITPGEDSDLTLDATYTGRWGVVGYGVDGGYVDFETFYCQWYGQNTTPAVPSDCPDCVYSFSVSFDTSVVEGESCELFEDALGPYGFTGPEYYVDELELGFIKVGSSSYNDLVYDYGYTAFYLSYPYYSWYTSTDYDAYAYANEADPTLTDFYAINGYYGITFEQ